MSVNALAKALGVPTPRINDVVREKRGITPDTAMRLARYSGGDARSWLNLQIAYDLRIAEMASGKAIARSVAPMKKAISLRDSAAYGHIAHEAEHGSR
jgi:antitoxin HigA-1